VVTDSGIKLEHLSFSVGDFAIEDLCLSIRRGEYFVLTGPNGAGKTVLVKLIAGLHVPASGTIRVNGRSITDLPPWKRNIGYVPQDGVLFPNRTVRENIRFGLEVRRLDKNTMSREVACVASMLGIAHLMDRRIEGLSGGEKQKVSLARGLAFKPSLLLLDEPASAVDEDARDAICHQLRNIQRRLGVTTMHVSHNRRETRLVADRVGVLIGGRLREVVGSDEYGRDID